MPTDALPRKHRAIEPIPAAERPAPTREHRAARTTDLPVAAILGLLLLVLATYLTLRG